MVDVSSLIYPAAFSSHPARCPASKEPIEKDVWEAWGDRPVWARGAAAAGARLLSGTAARLVPAKALGLLARLRFPRAVLKSL